jgi:parallel beta-helix repeat protein
MTLIVILFFISLSVVPSTGTNVIKQTAIAVSGGKTLFVGGSGPGNYTKIQDAIDNASDGDTVFVFDESAPYYEHITINKTINLIGEDMNTTIIDGEGKGTIIHMYANRINISGFTFRNSGEDFIAIRVYSSKNNIYHNIIENNRIGVDYGEYQTNNRIISNIFINNFIAVDFGFYSTNTTVYDNNFINNSFGIDDTKSYYNTMVGNIFRGNGFGIYLTASAFSIISKNIFTDNRDCIKLLNSYSNSITDNTIVENTHGIKFEGGYDHPSYDNTISSNNISKCSGFAIHLHTFCKKNTITENNIINNRNYGILVVGNNNMIFKNNIKNTNGIGVCLDSTNNNNICSNNFINNKINALFAYEILNFANNWKQNYWDRGRVLPKAIFGIMIIWIVPIPWLDFDWYPVLEPYDF